MTHDFDSAYWERHWREAPAGHPGAWGVVEPNPHLVRETAALAPGTALDAGCGEGGEAIWLATCGWSVTAADLSAAALARAAKRAAAGPAESNRATIQWVQADLTVWEPGTPFDLVTTHYAHPTIPQLAFYDRISRWVAPGGTLLVVGHLHAADHGHGSESPAEALVTLADITAGLEPTRWEIATAEEHDRTATTPDGRGVPLHDVVVRATRLS